MLGFEFLNYGTQILHSKDLDDMRGAILSDDDQEIDCKVSDFCRVRKQAEARSSQMRDGTTNS